MKTLLITPTYNEIENLRPLLEEIFSYVPETDVLIVDDHSPDGTGELADEIHNANSRVKVLHRPGKLGLGTAYIAGFKYAIEHGSAAQPPPPASSAGSRKGRRKQSKAKNLLDALLGRAEQVLALLDDLRIPFTNNQAERDLRWAKVQQKIAGTFRSATGVTAFCRIRRYLSTMQKQGHPMLSALTAVFHGQALPVAWEPE